MLLRRIPVLFGLLLLSIAAAHAQDPPPADAPADAPVVLAAGDIADCAKLGGAMATARLLDRLAGTVLVLGDTAYDAGTQEQFEKCYAPTWGRHRERSRAVIGNHEMRTRRGEPFYKYFGELAGDAGKGYYSFDLGTWHLIGLNSEIEAGPRSPMVKWLKEDLAAHPSDCILAYWHTPLFSSGPHGPVSTMLFAWKELLAARADVILNGHDHDYERFAPQDEKGKASPVGIRQFVVGTGGGGVYEFKHIAENSEVRGNTAYGVIKLTLKPGGYDWEFVPGAGQFTDKGTAQCTPKP